MELNKLNHAFIKENNLEQIGINEPERPLYDKPNYFTPNGFKFSHSQINLLKIKCEQLKKMILSPNNNCYDKTQ
jgi:hypothetical protein